MTKQIYKLHQRMTKVHVDGILGTPRAWTEIVKRACVARLKIGHKVVPEKLP